MKNKHLIFIFDKSGSMAGKERSLVEEFNRMIKAHQGEENVFATVVLFDSDVRFLQTHVPLSELKELTVEDCRAGGLTALHDAVGMALTRAYEAHGDELALTVIATDGQENASREFGGAQIRRLISAREELGWQFLYFGANVNAEREGEQLGISRKRSIDYTTDCEGMKKAFCCMCAVTEDFLCGEIDEDALGEFKDR